jgi:tight adherence protein B
MVKIIVITVVWAVALVFIYAALIEAFTERKRIVSDRVTGLGYDSELEQRKKQLKLKLNNNKKPTSAFAKTRKEFIRLEDELYNLGIKMPVQTFFALWIAIALGVPILMIMARMSLGLCVAFALIAAFGPFLYLRRKRNKRKQTLERQLIDGINIMCNALRAGHSFQTAMHNIALDMEGPIAEEFGRVFRETQRGMSLEQSLNALSDRVDSDDLEILCQAILIQRRVGGNLAEVLENISGTIRKRLDIKEEIGVLTSSGKISGYIVGGLPIILIVLVSIVNPTYMTVLFTTVPGYIMLGISIVMEVIGFSFINKIVDIDY